VQKVGEKPWEFCPDVPVARKKTSSNDRCRHGSGFTNDSMQQLASEDRTCPSLCG
jgi:hypothetical protein